MTCHDVQQKLSLYLYGELDFATEEAVEAHLETCAFCQQALEREKSWHIAATSEQRDVPLELLAGCRQDLRLAITQERTAAPARTGSGWAWPGWLQIAPHGWSYQLAAASFLVFLGFAGSRLVDRFGGSASLGPLTTAGFLNPSTARIRDIQSSGPGRVRIIFDQVNQRELVGSPDDESVRPWLLAAIQDPGDPGIRVDSVEVLSNQTGKDVRDALLDRIQHDSNAAVRLKALESVRRFVGDPETRNVLRSVLETDSNPAVRSEAIDVLAPANEKVQISPELTMTLQTLARSEGDDYIRGRCLQLLHAMNAPNGIY